MEFLKDLDFPEKLHRRLISKIMNIAIRCNCYIYFAAAIEIELIQIWWTSKPLSDFFFLFCFFVLLIQ